MGESSTCVRDCESNNGGCVDSECINNRCVACGENEYFNTAAEECQTDPCKVEGVCGGNSCSHDQGSVTCSCSEENYKYDSESSTCVRDRESNNGGCVDSECINNRCVACGENEYFNTAAEECQTDPCKVGDVCGGNSCSHDQGSVTCSCSDENYKYDSESSTCVRDCESNNGGCVDSECINNRCVACGENEYFNTAAEECQSDPCKVGGVCGGNSCSHDQG